MQITVTFRHVDPSDALRAHAEERLERVKKYLQRPVDAHVILEVAKDRHVAEVTLQADHTRLFAKEVTGDLYAAIDLAVTKLEHQAQKLHAKRAGRKGGGSAAATAAPLAAEPDGPAPRTIVRGPAVDPVPLMPEQALERLDATGAQFLVFVNAATKGVAVLYRRTDGTFGLIEPDEHGRR